MNRDAMPSEKEAKAEHRSYLREHGCTASGCDVTDPDALSMLMPRTHSCNAHQQPHLDPQPFCDEHADTRSYVDQQLAELRERDDADGAAVYECDIVEAFTIKSEEVVIEGKVFENPHAIPNAEVAVRHRCGEPIRDIIIFDDDGGESA